jgi:hypothetical protein
MGGTRARGCRRWLSRRHRPAAAGSCPRSRWPPARPRDGGLVRRAAGAPEVSRGRPRTRRPRASRAEGGA